MRDAAGEPADRLHLLRLAELLLERLAFGDVLRDHELRRAALEGDGVRGGLDLDEILPDLVRWRRLPDSTATSISTMRFVRNSWRE